MKSFPGRNWINNEDVIDCLGLLHFSGLLRPAFAKFLEKSGPTSKSMATSASPPVAADAEGEALSASAFGLDNLYAELPDGPTMEGGRAVQWGYTHKSPSAKLRSDTTCDAWHSCEQGWE